MAESGYVFISYSSRDIAFVQELVELMAQKHISYWKAPEMIPAGSNYAKEIPKAISGCEIFLLVLSQISQNSIWVEKEVDLAICNRKTIIPVQIDNEPLNDMYRFYLNNVQMICTSSGNDTDYKAIIERVQRLLGAEDNDSVKREKDYVYNSKNKKHTTRNNALRINRIPHECEYCGGEVEQDTMGIYLCVKCGRENYDDFQKVRNYLDKAGAAPAAVISRNTKVPLKTIEYFWREEFLEIPKTLNMRIPCQKCGAPIRAGYLCDFCKNIVSNDPDKKEKGSWCL